MTVADLDGQEILSTDYRVGGTDAGWTVVSVLGGTYAAVSPSHTRTDMPQSNMLSCPRLTLTGTRPMLRWKARSIHPYLPDAYRVLVQEEGASQPEVALEVAAENGQWTTRAVDLTPWLGKSVTISFECVSVNKYMLAIDDIKVGDPQETSYIAHATNGEFAGLAWDFPGSDSGTARLSGTVANMGKPLAGGKLVLLSGGAASGTVPLPDLFACGEEVTYEFDLPISLDHTTDYTIAVEDASGNRTTVLESRVRASHFARTHVATEYTGLWCNNCPAAGIGLEDLEYRFGRQLIKLVGHIQTANNDPMECADYRAETYAGKYFSVPRMVFNHNRDTNAADCSKFSLVCDETTPVDIEICEYSIEGGKLTAKAAVTWASDLDNSSDRYRIGYVLTHDVVTPLPVDGYNQSNSTTSVKSDRYYYLPTRIKSDLSPNVCTVAWGKNSGQGWEKSLPKRLTGMKTVGADILVELDPAADPEAPASLTDLTKARLVAYVIDTQTGAMLNACYQNLDEECDPAHKPDPNPDPDPDPEPDPDPDPEPEVDTATLTAQAPAYAAQGDFEVTATVGSTSESGLDNWTLTFECDGSTQTESGAMIPYGEQKTLTFTATAMTDMTAEYTLTLTAEHLEEPLTATGAVSGLAFIPARRILVEQAASADCPLTPAAMCVAESLDSHEDVIPVAVHLAGDPMHADGYAPFAGTAPSFRVDRDPEAVPAGESDCVPDPDDEDSALARILAYRSVPAFVSLGLDAAYVKNSGKVTGIDVMADLTPAKTLDGSELAWGFILTENNVTDPAVAQANGLSYLTSLPETHPFRLLPATVPGMYFQDVAREVYGYSGLDKSVPMRRLEPGKKVTYHTVLSMPACATDTRELYLTACLYDVSTGRVMNAVRVPLSTEARPKVTARDVLDALTSIPGVEGATPRHPSPPGSTFRACPWPIPYPDRFT